jgi:hypothetical protein
MDKYDCTVDPDPGSVGAAAAAPAGRGKIRGCAPRRLMRDCTNVRANWRTDAAEPGRVVRA